MAAAEEAEPKRETLLEKLRHDDEADADGFADSVTENEPQPPSSPPTARPQPPSPQPPSSEKNNGPARLFGRKRPIHAVLGGGQPADVLLWRNRNISAGVLGLATAIWVIFELLHYHLLAFVCHGLIFSLAILFLWSNASLIINKSTPRIPELKVSEDLAVNVAQSVCCEINRAFSSLREIAAGKNIKKFLIAVAGLWLLSILGKHCTFLTLIYTVFVVLHSVPVLYEKYEDQVDAFGEKTMAEIRKQYAVLDAQLLSKIPRGPSKDKDN